jgi:hypothetical protein
VAGPGQAMNWQIQGIGSKQAENQLFVLMTLLELKKLS